MLPLSDLLLLIAIGGVAWLYSSVGHAGASGYIAVLSIAGLAPQEIKPLALLLNILVATIATVQFYRAGHFSWSLFWPIALLAPPMAFLGGYIPLPIAWFKGLLGLILAASSLWLLFPIQNDEQTKPLGMPQALGIGASLGLLSGLTGTGGGIYLTPLLLFCRWAKTKTASAISAPFILVNSISGLAGVFTSGAPMPSGWFLLAIAVILGGGVGATLGSYRLPVRWARILLAIVMLIAAFKLLAI